MAKKMLIDATHAEETRVVVVDGNKVEEFDFESENKRQLAGNIYLAKVTRVEPSLQAAFVDYGGNRHGFLAFSEIHPDYYQIPVADREALMAEERAYAEAQRARDEEEEEKPKRKSRSRSRSKSKAAEATAQTEIAGMETIDLTEADGEVSSDSDKAHAPVDRVAEAPVEDPDDAPEAVAEAVDSADAAEAAPEAEAEENVAAEDTHVAQDASEPEAEPASEGDADSDAAQTSDAEVTAEATANEDAPEAEDTPPADEDGKPTSYMSETTPKDQDAVITDDASEGSDTEAAPEDAPVAEEVTAEAEPGEDVAAGDIDGETPAVDATDATETVAEEAAAPEAVDDTAEAEPVADDAQADEAPAEDATQKEAAPLEGEILEAEEDTPDDIESVADEDDAEDIRRVRKPRPRRYKIQEVIKVRQIMLVQVVKEERGNKGAALTTYLSLAGRYCVLMPNTARGGGISRKITNAADRKKLKDIASDMDVPQGAGLIVRTAGAKRTKAEIKRDYEYLQRMWEQIRALTLQSIAPAKIYEEGDLIKRSIRDLYSREIDEVLVEGEQGYRNAKDFMKMIMPSHAKNVRPYTDAMPLFARYQVETYLAGMFNPTVQLKSGGYIVIGVTEALVAIDVNSGKATKEGSIEETALKTNLEAADEVARQLRLRDLAGLIVIDFIDMDERKNNSAVEKRMKDRLKTDRARIQVGRISGFGLMEMSRQRLRPGMLEATTQPCPHCHGTGLIRSTRLSYTPTVA
ncbi:MAG: Rne/Rng family ribonuclease, partial [Rhodobacteraceae bacterium]|nr:Rne/Rng family ribonuclease [Paracoccaceae bacterium]